MTKSKAGTQGTKRKEGTRTTGRTTFVIQGISLPAFDHLVRNRLKLNRLILFQLL